MTWARSIRRLTKEDEKALVLRIREGDREALDTLVLSHLGFVAKIASRYAGSGAPVEDLFNEGTLGLIEAARRYDPERGLRFLTYAVFWVRRAILAALKLYTSPIRIPESRRRQASRSAVRAPLTVRAAAKPPQAVSYERTGKQHSDLLTTGQISLDHQFGQAAHNVLGDLLQDANLPDTVERLIHKETTEAVESGINGLSDVERFVLHHRFGFGGAKRRTLEDIGREMGVTRERVRQIELRAREKLGKLLRRREVTERIRSLRPPRTEDQPDP